MSGFKGKMAIVSLKHNPFQNSLFLPTALFCFKLQNKYINKAKSLQVWGPSCQSQGTLHAQAVPQAVWALKNTLKITLTISNHKTLPDQPCQEEWIFAVLYTAWGYRPAAVHLPSDNFQDAVRGGNARGAAMVVWKGCLSLSMSTALRTLCKASQAYEGHTKAAVTQHTVHVQLMPTGSRHK